MENRMLALPPENLTDEELIRNAYQYIHDGLPIRWQKEIFRRYTELYDANYDLAVSHAST